MRKGLNFEEKDNENKNIYHFCAYSGSIKCLKTLREFIKIEKIRKLNEEYLRILKKCNYKRTDMKNG